MSNVPTPPHQRNNNNNVDEQMLCSRCFIFLQSKITVNDKRGAQNSFFFFSAKVTPDSSATYCSEFYIRTAM